MATSVLQSLARKHRLPMPLARRLLAYCLDHPDEEPEDVIADALALHLDEVSEERFSEGAAA